MKPTQSIDLTRISIEHSKLDHSRGVSSILEKALIDTANERDAWKLKYEASENFRRALAKHGDKTTAERDELLALLRTAADMLAEVQEEPDGYQDWLAKYAKGGDK